MGIHCMNIYHLSTYKTSNKVVAKNFFIYISMLLSIQKQFKSERILTCPGHRSKDVQGPYGMRFVDWARGLPSVREDQLHIGPCALHVRTLPVHATLGK